MARWRLAREARTFHDEGMRVVPAMAVFASSLAACAVLFSAELTPTLRGLPQSPPQAYPPTLPLPPTPKPSKSEPNRELDFLADPPDPEHV